MVNVLSETEVGEISEKIVELMSKKPIYFFDVLNEFRNVEYRKILLAFGKLRSEKRLSRDENGRYVLSK